VISRSSPWLAMMPVSTPANIAASTRQTRKASIARRLVSILFQTNENMAPIHIASSDKTNNIIKVKLIVISYILYVLVLNNHICIHFALQIYTGR
jgi:hypothetical protein